MPTLTASTLSEEKRSRGRSPLGLRPRVRVEFIQDETVKVLKACLFEIGRTGLSLEIITPITPGTPITVFLESLPEFGISKVVGVVKWLSPLELKDSCGECGFRVGLRLAELLPDVGQTVAINNTTTPSMVHRVPGGSASLPEGIADKRGFIRLKKSIPVKMALAGVRNPRSFDVIANDINSGGILADVLINDRAVMEGMIGHFREVHLNIRLSELNLNLKVRAKPAWFKKHDDLIDERLSCGFKFVDLSEGDRRNLERYIDLLKKEEPFEKLVTYPLYVGGKDVDTWDYEFFPYAEKSILEFKKTYRIVSQLKQGERPTGFEDYVYARYCVGDSEINQKAMAAAHRAAQIFGKFPISARRKILLDIRDLLVSHRDELIKLFIIEGHPRKLAEWEFLGMERGVLTSTLEFYAQELWRELKSGDERVVLSRKPDGVVCISSPKNAPCSISFLGVLSILAGNTLVVKPPLKMPISSIYLWKNVVDAAMKMNGAPEGCVNVVIGNSKEIMDQWLESPLVNDIMFFGDSVTGLEIGKRIYLKGKKPILELSGNDIVFVWKDADIPKAVSATVDAFLGSTQICIVPKNVFVHEKVYDRYLEALVKEVRKLKIGLPTDSDTILAPVSKMSDFFETLESSLLNGAELVCGGKRVDHCGQSSESGCYLEPTILKIHEQGLDKLPRVITDENFFPLLPVVKISGSSDEDIFNKMIKFSDQNRFGLRTSVWVKSKEFLNRFIHEINNSGLVRVNVRHIGFSMFIATNGGTGQSGGPFGEMNYVWQKTSHLQGVVYKEEPE